MKQNRGIALIIVSSLLVLLAVAAASLLSLASGLRQRSAVNIDHETARLLAKSGAAYAYSRLVNPFARAEASDDWAFRDDPSTPLESSLNPSYAHGEPYRDLGGDGRFGAADPYTDLNANGRFDAWSGRLRGKFGLADSTFLLKIASSEGKIDINGGTLAAQDTDGDKTPDCCDWLDHSQRRPTGSDTEWTGLKMPAISNMHGSEVVNLLGEVMYDAEHPPVAAPEALRSDTTNILYPETAPTPLMQAGDRLLQTRPPGGYRSLDEARGRVSREAWERIGPYLTTHGSCRTPVWEKASGSAPRAGRAQAIALNAADRVLLQALFLRCLYSFSTVGEGGTYMLGREDGGRIADFLMQNRPFASRYDFFRKLDAAKGTVFPAPIYDPARRDAAVDFVAEASEGIPGVFTGTSDMYVGGKHSDFPFFSWGTYDIPRTNQDLLLRCGYFNVTRWRFPRAPFSSSSFPLYLWWSQLLPLSLDAGDAVSVSIESLGRVGGSGARRAQTTLSTSHVQGIVDATSQNDFENHEEQLRPWYGAGPDPKEDVQLKVVDGRRLEGDAESMGRPEKLRTQSWPGYPLDSMPRFRQGGVYTIPQSAMQDYFPRDCFGNVALMPFAGRAHGGEFFYMPCWQKGQPLRALPDSGRMEDNFANAVSDPPSAVGFGIAPGGGQLQVQPWVDADFRALIAHRPTTIPADTAHQWAFKDFPWFAPNGAFGGGTFDYWGIMAGMRLVNDYYGYSYMESSISSLIETPLYGGSQLNTIEVDVNLVVGSTAYRAMGEYAPYAPHRLTVAMSNENLQGYLDGIPDPRLFGPPEYPAANPIYKVTWLMGSGYLTTLTSYPRTTLGDAAGDVRGFPNPRQPEQILASALQDPYFWTSEAHPDVPGIPSYTSPLCLFPHPVRLASASWDGFVPAKIRDAIPQTPPLRVELLVYRDAQAVPGTEQILPLPADGWKTGGESVDLEKLAADHSIDLRARAFRYRVWFDASAMGAPGNETPVFNSIRIAYRGGHAMEGLAFER